MKKRLEHLPFHADFKRIKFRVKSSFLHFHTVPDSKIALILIHFSRELVSCHFCFKLFKSVPLDFESIMLLLFTAIFITSVIMSNNNDNTAANKLNIRILF